MYLMKRAQRNQGKTIRHAFFIHALFRSKTHRAFAVRSARKVARALCGISNKIKFIYPKADVSGKNFYVLLA
jgi:hypothetical protein